MGGRLRLAGLDGLIGGRLTVGGRQRCANGDAHKSDPGKKQARKWCPHGQIVLVQMGIWTPGISYRASGIDA
jgi:hypothetical protein